MRLSRGQLGHQLDHLAGQLLQVDAQRLDLDVLGGGLVLDRLDPGLQVGRFLHQLEHPEAGQAVDHERVVVLAHLEQLDDLGDRAHRV